MKNRRISGCVTVTGPPFAIWARNVGTTLPLLASTLPNRTAAKRVVVDRPRPSTTISATRLVAPITLGRVHGLVRGDQHKPLDAPLVRGLSDDACAEDVVLHGLARVVFHERHVFVGGRVKHHLWAQRAEDLVDSARFGDVGQDGMKRHGGRTLGELVVDVKKAVLVVIEEHKACRAPVTITRLPSRNWRIGA